jgi:hypothetical protein
MCATTSFGVQPMQVVSDVSVVPPRGRPALSWSHGAAEQGVEADEAWSTSELRSLTPVLGGLF